MKRSQINHLIKEAEAFYSSHQFHLPPWAFWTLDQWQQQAQTCQEIIQCGLGWDITDFGSGNFSNRGLILFTLRNGIHSVVQSRSAAKGQNHQDATQSASQSPPIGLKPYAEKIMIVQEQQETPFHYHWYKMEDIINRGGGTLVFELAWAGDDDLLSTKPVTISMDGQDQTFQPGELVYLKPGQSICLPPKLYHRFYGLKGNGPVLCGEVSTVNDDQSDNRFLEPLGRFPAIEEDQPPYRLMVGDYTTYLSGESVRGLRK
jgi:D-lyxose ketol-isomerase